MSLNPPAPAADNSYVPISPKQFAELISTSRLSDLDTSARDGRRARRVDYRAIVRVAPVTPTGAGDFFDVQLQDFSVRGVRLVDSVAMPAGSQFLLDFPCPNGTTTHLLCSVVHCEELAPRQFAIGAEFTCTVPAHPMSPDDEAARIRRSMLD